MDEASVISDNTNNTPTPRRRRGTTITVSLFERRASRSTAQQLNTWAAERLLSISSPEQDDRRALLAPPLLGLHPLDNPIARFGAPPGINSAVHPTQLYAMMALPLLGCRLLHPRVYSWSIVGIT